MKKVKISTINPATGELSGSYDIQTAQAAKGIVIKANQQQQHWAQQSLASRAELLLNVAKLLKDNSESYANVIVKSMGKPIKQARAEVSKCAWVCEHYANNTQDYLKSIDVPSDYKLSKIVYSPLGVIFAIMPWNFPFWQVFRFAAPAIMAGNAVILKHADICTEVGLVLEQLLRDAGAPDYLFNTVIIDHTTADEIIADDNIAGVTLTGSERAGAQVASAAGRNLKKVVLELGGNDPYIVLEDADLELAADLCVKSRLNNTGQVCIAAKRLIVVENVADKFKQLVIDKISTYKMGDPLDEQVDLGPIARQDLKDSLNNQVKQCIELGAKNLIDYKVDLSNKNQKGFYYSVIALDNVTKGMPAYDDELFGPVFAFITAADTKEAIEVANDSKYGLSAAVFTSNQQLAEDIAVNQLNVGTVAINNLVSSDPRLPFGGIKKSGYGRELGREGLLEFINIKTIIS